MAGKDVFSQIRKGIDMAGRAEKRAGRKAIGSGMRVTDQARRAGSAIATGNYMGAGAAFVE